MPCHYCSAPATDKRMVYDEVMGCSSEVDVCADCRDAVDNYVIGVRREE